MSLHVLRFHDLQGGCVPGRGDDRTVNRAAEGQLNVRFEGGHKYPLRPEWFDSGRQRTNVEAGWKAEQPLSERKVPERTFALARSHPALS
ncbi:hypothetical protein D3273_26165 [Lichenibacterium minor]|uniref:Uncharacterized protein n=1 Tax=Lichenibacterium minor TaxID=2316528 RepID=A0A4Q2TZ52_9HYPH|nr:hypothetical protein [Lichenibacterium minor]RYC29020.1 hypothetical protein D3273_26165 [Lichenibacterium minor]